MDTYSTDFLHLCNLASKRINSENIDYKDIMKINFDLLKHHRFAPALKLNPNFDEKNNKTKALKHYIKKKKFGQTKLTLETLFIESLASANGIRILFQKGIALDELLYDGNRERISRDVDLLIHPSDVEKFHSILIANGYVRLYVNFELNKTQLKGARKNLNQFAYRHPKKKTIVEVHWRLFRNPKILNIDFNKLWDQKQSIKLHEKEIFILPQQILTLFLITHAALHGWERLFWLIDIGLILNNYDEQSWKKLLTESKKHGLLKPVQQSLYLLEKWLKINLDSNFPNETPEKIGIHFLPHFVIDTNHFLYTGGTQTNQLKSIQYSAHIISPGRVYPFHLLNHSVLDYKVLPLPNAFIWLYSFIHPITWVIKKFKNNN